jgi:hypothetical protein
MLKGHGARLCGIGKLVRLGWLPLRTLFLMRCAFFKDGEFERYGIEIFARADFHSGGWGCEP